MIYVVFTQDAGDNDEWSMSEWDADSPEAALETALEPRNGYGLAGRPAWVFPRAQGARFTTVARHQMVGVRADPEE